MPDVGHVTGVRDEKRSNSLECLPRVGGMSDVRRRGRTSIEMNLESIEEHQAESLVSAQYNYLYILLEATSACVIVPIAKVPRT